MAATALVDAASVAVFVNQAGYDLGRPKVATVTNTTDGTAAYVKDAATDATVATLTVASGKVDLTTLDAAGTYRIVCNAATSHDFRVGKYWNQRSSATQALAFMNEARSDAFERGIAGIAWRDSHQFSFEMHTLVAQYCANPALYERLPYSIVETATCDYPELRTQAEPDIIWLMKFAAHRYVDRATTGGRQLHALTKGQLPFFLWLYPHISHWVPSALYTAVRDVAVNQWATATTNLSWYDTGTSNDMFATQASYGPPKGSEPPGHKILPNLLMWQVALRDGLPNPGDYLAAAVANASWLVSLDPTAPEFSKGQRMSEHVTLTGLCHLIEAYPEHAPPGALAWVETWADKMLARSANLWDFRMESALAAGDAEDRWTNRGDSDTPGGGGYNEPGSIAGLPAPLLAARRVIADPSRRAALLKLAQAQFDQVFGRNPRRRHYCYAATTEFPGVEEGWHGRFTGGNGVLGSVTGVLDGAPLEGNYPFSPTITGYVEGWVAFNTAWNHALAYDAAHDVAVEVVDPATGAAISAAPSGSLVKVRLRAPLNLDEAVLETGRVLLTVDGSTTGLDLDETSLDGWDFEATLTVPEADAIEVSYGLGLFRQASSFTVGPYVPEDPPTPSGLYRTDGTAVVLHRTDGSAVSLS